MPEGAAKFRFHPKEVKPGQCFSGLFMGLKPGAYKMSQRARLGSWDRLGISFGEMTLTPKD